MKIRRVTTGHTELGKAVVVSDGEVDADTLGLMPGYEFHRLWGADVPPAFPNGGLQPECPGYFPPLGGFRFMMFTVAPQPAPNQIGSDRQALFAEMKVKLPGLAEHMEPSTPGMHTTDTVDFEYIVSGEVWLELDDGARSVSMTLRHLTSLI